MAKRTPEQVFTPAKPVSDDMFANRQFEGLQKRVEGALLEQGRQVILYGETGVGKTSLVNHVCRTRSIKRIRVECGDTFEEMMRGALGQVIDRTEIETVEKLSAELSFGAKIHAIFNAEAKASISGERRFQHNALSLSSTVAEAFRLKKIDVLFLDNFENLSAKGHYAETATDIAQLMKSFSDRADEFDDAPKVVVAGIPAASHELIDLDVATARRTAQIEVPRMPEEELEQILIRGETKLGMRFEGLIRPQIVKQSDGFPYYTHLFALHASRCAIENGNAAIAIDDFDDSLDSILLDCDLVLRNAYNSAVETTGTVRARKSILDAVAVLDHPEVPFRDIRESFLRLHPEYKSAKQLNFLSTAIKPLKDEYGILADSGKPKSPNNLYRFTNPLMRGYIRLQMRRSTHPELPLD